ncbi:MAG: DNA mismatch repair protein MutS [Thermodesulfobacteriota bacterium]
MNPSKITPMLQQYLSVKETYPDTLLFYRMGDFYEMFFEDAEIAAKALEITLTSRNKKDKDPIPMCGVPVRSVQGYIARLLDSGFKVAICDQVEDPAVSKGLVKREVVRVVTPGMIVENELLDEKTNNYVLSIFRDDQTVGIASIDISTGVFRVTEAGDASAMLDETLRISPREVLLPESSQADPFFKTLLKTLAEKSVTFLNSSIFEYGRCRQRLLDQFRTLSLEGFGCETLKSGVRAAGAIVYYIGETQKKQIEHVSRIETYSLNSYLAVDELSCQNLELIRNIRSGTRKGTLIAVIDRTLTAMGGRLLKNWLRYPLMDLEMIQKRLDAVQEIKENARVRRSLQEHLGSVFDLERLSSKITLGHCNARDLLALQRSLQLLPPLTLDLKELSSELFQLNVKPDDLYRLADLIEKAIREDAPPVVNEGGIIKKGFDSELDELMAISRDGKSFLAKLEAQERASTAINTLKVRYNKVFGYYIEVSKAQAKSVPPHYVRKQTLVNAERYITDELKTFEAKVLGAEERRASLEYEIFNRIRTEVIKNNKEIQLVAQFLARVDCLASLAEVADQNHYTRPLFNPDGIIAIEDGRHPVVEKMISAERFVPNSIRLDTRENQILIITGPNMAGKSTVLRQVALIVIMSQMGSFVPAAAASVSMVDRIFTRVGALDNLSQGQSTFMVEMQETANILNNASDRSLVIMDEIGRGTSTFDGLSIAWAVAEFLHDLHGAGVKTLFATHYHELTDLAQVKPRVKNFNIAVKEWNDEIIFLRKLVEGGTNRSYGIQVARLAGIPAQVIARAKKILANIEKGEHNLNGSPIFAEGEKSEAPKTSRQLDLFRKPEHVIVDKLQKLDLSKMTPLEAMISLNELQEKAKTVI